MCFPSHWRLCEKVGRPVDEIQDVELEHVAPELDGELERAQRVLRCECRRATVPDARKLAGRPAELNHAGSFTPRA